jgi:hypothetical protein
MAYHIEFADRAARDLEALYVEKNAAELESSRCSDSNGERRAPVVACAQVPFGNAAAGKRVPVLTCPALIRQVEITSGLPVRTPKTSDCCVVTFRSAGEQDHKHAPSAIETLFAGLD